MSGEPIMHDERYLTSDEAILSIEAEDRWWARYGEKVKADLDRTGWVKVAFKDGFKAAILATDPAASPAESPTERVGEQETA